MALILMQMLSTKQSLGQMNNKLNETGFGSIQIGKKITDLDSVILYSIFPQREDYFSNDENHTFFVYTGDIYQLTGSALLSGSIERIFIVPDKEMKVTLIEILFAPTDETAEIFTILNDVYGPPNSGMSGLSGGHKHSEHSNWHLDNGKVLLSFSAFLASSDLGTSSLSLTMSAVYDGQTSDFSIYRMKQK
ncbi:hypothetical protein [Chitinophaga barathri]|nr:hypothetical protein [Chitinophaga barathri]